MAVGDGPAHGQPLRAHPGLHWHGGIKESDVFTRAVTGCRDGQCLQVALLHQLWQPLQRHQPGQQRGQRGVVQQRARADMQPFGNQLPHTQHHAPAGGGVQHGE